MAQRLGKAGHTALLTRSYKSPSWVSGSIHVSLAAFSASHDTAIAHELDERARFSRLNGNVSAGRVDNQILCDMPSSFPFPPIVLHDQKQHNHLVEIRLRGGKMNECVTSEGSSRTS